jgi:acyl-CoA thioester hydrolase
MSIIVAPSDIDQLGHVNNVTYVRWVQDVAVAHWQATASTEEQVIYLWIVVRHEIDYKLPAYLQDKIIARTWVGAATRVRFDRHTEIVRESDGAVLARARTVWAPVERLSGKIVAVSPEVRARFSRE